MITKERSNEKIQKLLDVLGVILILLVVHFVVGAFNGKWPWSGNPYNSYALQAAAWLDGHLDLGMNIEYLELAVFEGKYFVSFPPFPSYVLLPFAYFYGSNTPDGWIAFFAMILGAIYALRIAWEYLGAGAKSVFWTAFLYVGTNVLYITLDGQVWFIAQSFALTLSLMAIFYAIKGKGGWSLFFWGCSVGCRPLQILYFPLLFYILYKYLKKECPERTLFSMIKEKFYWAIPVCIIALSYMMLNYARFGSPLEFGHNYLPEFTREENGQFHPSYVWNNIKSLFRLPTKGENGVLSFSKFDGSCIFLVIPMFVSYLIYYIRKFIRRQNIDKMFLIVLPVLVIVHIVALCSHRTMGGFHFGHRYINDVLPYLYWGVLIFAGTPGRKKVTQTEEELISVEIEEEMNIQPEEDGTQDNEVFFVADEIEAEQMDELESIATSTETLDEENVSDLLENSTEDLADFETTTATTSDNLTEDTTNTITKTILVEDPEQTDYTYTLHFALCFLGLALNIVGTIATNMGWV